MVVVRRICSNEEVVCVNFGETYLNAKKEKKTFRYCKKHRISLHFVKTLHFILSKEEITKKSFTNRMPWSAPPSAPMCPACKVQEQTKCEI